MSYYFRANPYSQIAAFTCAAACAAHGFYDLHQEGRLHRVLAPVSRSLNSLWAIPPDNHPEITEDAFLKPAFG
jgi:hypothetical protein